MNGLVIKSPWIEYILKAPKTWALRGSRTNTRGRVALARARSGLIVGTCQIIDCIGPMTAEELRTEAAKQQVPVEGVASPPSGKVYAWVLSDVKPFAEPIPYIHPVGTVVWVKLGPENVPTRLNELEGEAQAQTVAPAEPPAPVSQPNAA
jgi:hypothetical protein